MNTEESKAYSNHDEIWLLLPWYATGHLVAEERERVKSHLSVCLICRRELADQAALARHLQHEPALEISTKPSFDRLMARIQSVESSPVVQSKPPQQSKRPSLTAWINQYLDGLNPLQLAAACAGLLLAFSLPFLNLQQQEPGPGFHTVADSGSLDRFQPTDLRVIFAEQVTEQEIVKLISSIHGRIVDGPSPAGLFTIRLPATGEGATEVGPTLERLRSNSAVVFAEPAIPQPSLPKVEKGS